MTKNHISHQTVTVQCISDNSINYLLLNVYMTGHRIQSVDSYSKYNMMPEGQAFKLLMLSFLDIISIDINYILQNTNKQNGK